MSGLPPILLLTADAPSILRDFGPPQWGIYDQGGQPILVSDSVGGVEYQREYDVSNYPQEQGAFASYNKVQIPYEAKVTLLSGLTREVLLSILEPAVASLQLVSVVMPEWGYQRANLTRYEFRRTARNGVTLLEVTVGCKEIRDANSMLSGSTTPQALQQQQQEQVTAGTNRPIGQVNGGSSLVPGGSAPSVNTGGQAAAINTGSTNAAYPTQSGPVQSVTPAASAALPPPNKSFLIMGEPITNPAQLQP